MSIARGFQASYDVVSKALKSRDEAKLKEQLAQESERYGVTEGAYGPELQQNIQQLRGLQAQDPAQANAYGQAIQELERRSAMTAPDYSVGSRATNFGTRQEAQQAAAPMRAQGLSNVYRQAGEVVEADELEARALDQQRAIAREAREQARSKQQQTLGDLQINKAQQQADDDARMRGFEAWQSENPTASVAAVKEAARAYKLNSNQVLSVTANMAGLQTNELALWKGEVQNAIKGKTDAELVDLFNKDERFDPSTDMERKVGRDGSVTLTLKRKDGTVVSTYKAPDSATATAYLRKQALEPETLADWLLDRKKTQAAIAASQATAARAGRSTIGQKVLDFVELYGRQPTEDEKAILVGLTGRPGAGRGMTEAEMTARAKAIFDAGEAKTFTQALDMVRQGDNYMSPQDQLIARMAATLEAEAAAKAAGENKDANTTKTGAGSPDQGLFRPDSSGRRQLLQPFYDVNEYRRRLAAEQTARDAASGSGLGMGNIAP